MNILKEIKHASSERIVEGCVDPTQAIVLDEFYNRRASGDYRDRAIDRLMDMKIPWHAEENISWNVMQRYVKIVCPYCGAMMKWYGVTGRQYTCECGANANVEATISFEPEREKK